MVHRNINLYALTFLICLSFQLAFAQFPRSVINEMSRREIRYRHYLWHNIRDNWNRYSSETRAEITRRGWAPPNPARSYDSNGNPVAITDNYAGEDFLYMHRQMINHARSIAGSRNARYFTGWNFIPAPGDRSYPVPPRYSVPGSSSTSSSINNRKSNAFYYDNIMPMEDLFNDPDELRSMTLAELGVRLENTIHNWCHIRFSSSESSYRPGGSGPFPIFDTIWDRPSYDWLGDTYSSHVSPLFWKIHGWVDNKIEAWRIANGLRRITWRGRWEGGPMSTLSDILNPGSTSSGVTAMAMTASLASEGNNSVERTESIVSEDFTGSSSDSFVPESSFADNVQIDLGTFGKAAASKVNPIPRPKTPKTGPTRRLESKTSLRRT